MQFTYASIVVVVQLPSRVQLSVTPWTAALQAFLSLTISQSLPEFMSIESVMHLYLYRWIYIYIHIYISIYDFMYTFLLVTKISNWKSAALPLWMKTCPSPSAFTRMKSLATAVTGLQYTLKGVQGREWGTLCSGKNWQNRPSDS